MPRSIFHPVFQVLPSGLFADADRFPDLLLETDEAGRLSVLHFLREGDAYPEEVDPEKTAHVQAQLAEYFAGQRTVFDVELAPEGTPFQQSVWALLREIPYGATRSYLDLANELGKPNATRAVGAANGANPIAIIQPCHRVIGSNGRLTGFAGGLTAKAMLLSLEGKPGLS